MNIAEAKAKLSEFTAAIERGEDVVIARGGVPVARIAPAADRRMFRIGMADGQVARCPDFLESMSDGELRSWECRSKSHCAREVGDMNFIDRIRDQCQRLHWFGRTAALALLLATSAAQAQDVPVARPAFLGAFAGSAVPGRDCRVLSGQLYAWTRYGAPSFFEGTTGASETASNAVFALIDDITAGAAADGFHAILNLRIEATLTEDFNTEQSMTFRRNGRLVFADGSFMLVAYGDAVQLDCEAAPQ